MDETEMDQTSFIKHNMLYRYNRMSFALKNAPATFQRAVKVTLSTVKWKQALVYINDMVILSPTPGGHFKHVKSLLRFISEAGMTLKMEKDNNFQKRSTIL